jgi:hypothetical protein
MIIDDVNYFHKKRIWKCKAVALFQFIQRHLSICHVFVFIYLFTSYPWIIIHDIGQVKYFTIINNNNNIINNVIIYKDNTMMILIIELI